MDRTPSAAGAVLVTWKPLHNPDSVWDSDAGLSAVQMRWAEEGVSWASEGGAAGGGEEAPP